MCRPRRRELRDIRSMYPFPSEHAIVSRICRLSRPSRSAVAGSVSSRGGAGSGNLGISIMRKPDGAVSAWHLSKGWGAKSYGMRILHWLHPIKKISLNGCRVQPELLRKCSSKKKISLNGCRVQPELLRKCPSKKKISLNGCRVQPEVPRKCPSKKKISLNGCRVQPEVPRKCPSKKKISLNGCRVQPGLLRKAPSKKRISLNGCSVQPEVLIKCSSKKKLSLYGCRCGQKPSPQ